MISPSQDDSRRLDARRPRPIASAACVASIAVCLCLPGASAGAATTARDPTLEVRLAGIEELARGHPDRAGDALAKLADEPSFATDARLRLRRDLLRALLAEASGSTEDALRRLESLQEALDSVGDARLRIQALSLRANIMSDLNRFSDMGEAVAAERREAEKLADEGLLATADIDRAWYACQTGNYSDGEAAILSARNRVKSRLQSADTAMATAMLANMVDDSRTALGSAELAARLYREEDDPAGEAEALVEVAATQRQFGRAAEAAAAAGRALEIRRAGGDRLGEAIALLLLGEARLDEDRVAEALETSAQAVALFPDDAKVYLATAKTRRAHLMTSAGHPAEARALLADVGLVADAIGDRALRLAYHEELGRLALASGDYRRARDEEQRAQQLRRERTEGLVERQLAALRSRLEAEELARKYALLREEAELAARAARMTRAAFVLGAILLVGAALAYWRQRALARRLDEMTRTDALTGVLNRRGVFEIGHRLLERCRHEGRSFAVLILDIDHFKRINDERGHRAGDEALQRVADVLQHNVRVGDHVGRHGGEEFAVLLPDATVERARGIAERIRVAVQGADPARTDRDPSMTISGGLAASCGSFNFEQLVDIADAALYRAKMSGRNRIEEADGPATLQAAQPAAASLSLGLATA